MPPVFIGSTYAQDAISPPPGAMPGQGIAHHGVAHHQFGADAAEGHLADGAGLHHQLHGQDRGNGHQDDQRHGDAHDLSPDRQSDHGKTFPSVQVRSIRDDAAAISVIDRRPVANDWRGRHAFLPAGLMQVARNAGRLSRQSLCQYCMR